MRLFVAVMLLFSALFATTSVKAEDAINAYLVERHIQDVYYNMYFFATYDRTIYELIVFWNDICEKWPSDEDVNMVKAMKELTNKLKEILNLKGEIIENNNKNFLFISMKINKLKSLIHKFIYLNNQLADYAEQLLVLQSIQLLAYKTYCLALMHIVQTSQMSLIVNDQRFAVPPRFKKQETGLTGKIKNFLNGFKENSGTSIQHKVSDEGGDHEIQQIIRKARAKFPMMCSNYGGGTTTVIGR